MKNLIFLILFSLVTIAANAQFDGIAKAINGKDVAALSDFFDTQVEITTPDEDDVFSKADAKIVMESFFSKYNVTAFKLQHKGTSKGKASEYAIGDMTASGQQFRVFIYISEIGGQTVIQQIQFEQD